MSSHWIVLLFLLVFIVLTAHHAWVGKRRTRGLVDYVCGWTIQGGSGHRLLLFRHLLQHQQLFITAPKG